MTDRYPEDVPVWGSPEPEPEPHRPTPGRSAGDREVVCSLCGGGSFREEEGRMDTLWGMASHKFTIRICERCGHTLFFYQGAGMPM